ncbi:hypothetical protein [Micromonospora parathelypteridis]|uniref:Uncharacterized protein n=1 Tax=Micromonospora parathelypteridis TaxID=1839617 RepID=A0A840VZL3_9ACTN|nr:hypothetical protein [Micromonospora parathelypteridis]MBB5479294.1 hypothetical protein [Micromonospora parathelypteridis]GGO02006.1 hypothetical protein GCM10011576_01040 [Micromonospora parathelypteridis]
MSNQSVRDKALMVASEARRIGLGQQEEATAIAVSTRISTLRDKLDGLRTTLEAARRLNQYGADIPLSNVDDGLERFRQRAGEGLPSKPALDAAARTVEGVENQLRQALREAWRSWCEQRLAELRRDRLVMLPAGEAFAAEETLADLEKLRRGDLRAAAIQQFAISHRELRAQLDSTPDPDPEVLDLLQRLQVGTTLDKLTPADLQLLYDRQLAGTVEVRRRAT